VAGCRISVDTAAHEGALEAGGRTIAVMGSGFAQPYPTENIPLLKRIADKKRGFRKGKSHATTFLF
jgi:DNA processing protein